MAAVAKLAAFLVLAAAVVFVTWMTTSDNRSCKLASTSCVVYSPNGR